MKLASFIHDRVETYGTVSAGGVHPVSDSFRRRHADLRAAIAGDAIGGLEQCCAEQPVAFDEVIFLPPIPNPDKIICAGLNYRKPYPVDGVAPPDPDNIVLFARYRDTLVGHLGELERPAGAAADTFDFEGEIAVVIGRGGRHITEADALSHVLGYSAMNEGSVRGWMKHSVHAGKNFHAAGSWGPWITTADEAGEPQSLELEVRLNGDVMQKTTASEMIYSLPELIAYISNLGPLSPGDVIATGSPDGTGGSRKPPVFLKPGDQVEVSVKNVGTLSNRVGKATR